MATDTWSSQKRIAGIRDMHWTAAPRATHPDQEASIDEALPGDDPTDRYEEACRRLDETLRTAVARGKDSSIVYAGLYGVLQSREEVVDLALSIERELLSDQQA